MNKNSLIIYSILALCILLYFVSGSLVIFGMIGGMGTVYFLLTTKKEKENIRNNLLFRTKKCALGEN